MGMFVRSKLVLGSIGTVIIVIIVILALVAWPASSARGYFYGGRCACGHEIFVRIVGDGLFNYSPGHGVPEHRSFNLRPQRDGWDIMSLPRSDRYWSSLEGENKVLGRVQFREGALWESWGSGTNWARLPRVHNVLRVWRPKLLRE